MFRKIIFSYVFMNFILFSMSSYAQPTEQEFEMARAIPIADVHMHTYVKSRLSSSWYLERMDQNNVKWGGGVGDYKPGLARTLGKRYISTLGQSEFMKVFREYGAEELTNKDNVIFKKLYKKSKEKFSIGSLKGFGELHTNNRQSGIKNRRNIKTDNPMMRELYSIANRYNGFIQIHSQYDDDFRSDILKLSSDFPNTITVLSHCLPYAKVHQLRSIFKQRENVVCEFSAQGRIQKRLVGLNSIHRVYGPNGPKSDWLNFIKEFPDQIMIGSDACCGWHNSYDEIINEIRTNFLPFLGPELMAKVAYKNAVRLFHLEEPGISKVSKVIVAPLASFPENISTSEMRADEIKKLMTGMTIIGVRKSDGLPFKIELNPDMTADYEFPRKGKLTGTLQQIIGEWWTEDALFCMQLEFFSKGNEVCPRIEKTGSKLTMFTNKSGQQKWSLGKKGNF